MMLMSVIHSLVHHVVMVPHVLTCLGRMHVRVNLATWDKHVNTSALKPAMMVTTYLVRMVENVCPDLYRLLSVGASTAILEASVK